MLSASRHAVLALRSFGGRVFVGGVVLFTVQWCPRGDPTYGGVSESSAALRHLEEALMCKSRLTRSRCHKVAREDFHFKHFPRRRI